jgi:hypothetical protein
MRQMHQKSTLSEPRQQTEKPVLVDAIDITLRTIEDRTKQYRNLVVAVSIVSMVSIVLAVLFRQWLLLAGLIMLVPLTGRFLFFDSHLVLQWRKGILEMARLRGLDVTAFLKAISGFRHVPPNSLKAMLSTLPASLEATRQQVTLSELAVVDEFETLERKNARRILLGTGLLTLALICLIGGAPCGSVTLLLLGGGLIAVVVAFGRR